MEDSATTIPDAGKPIPPAGNVEAGDTLTFLPNRNPQFAVSNMEYNTDLSNVKVGDVRLCMLSVGKEHPLYKKYVPCVITSVMHAFDKTSIKAETLEPVHFPADPEGIFWWDDNGIYRSKLRPAHDEKVESWALTEGHLETQGYPLKVWVSRHKDGQVILTYHKPTKRGQYWVDDQGVATPLPKGYFPDVTYESGPKEKIYYVKG